VILTEFIYDKWDSEKSKRRGAYKPIKYVINETGCWVCTSHYRDKDGYVIVNRNGIIKLHRFAFKNEVHDIDSSAILLHKCDNPACFNPEHMVPGKHQDNQRDKFAKGRGAKGETMGAAKLTEDQVRAIFNDTRILREIAEEYGIQKTTVSRIKLGRSWTYLKLKKEAK
jgi:hypothetical protein